MPAHGLLNRPTIVLTPSSTVGYIVRDFAEPIVAGTDVVLNVNAGVVLSDTLRLRGTFAFPADCTVTIVINSGGVVGGKGANGGNAGASITNPGSNGATGGHALLINDNVKVYVRVKGTGLLAAGGGGGGGGGGNTHLGVDHGGGGGGGAQGYPGGAGGAKGTADAGDGTAGTTSTFGSGGASTTGNTGGNGGGLAGYGWAASAVVGAARGLGGNPGSAIYSVGFPAPTVLEGNDSTHIKGAITT